MTQDNPALLRGTLRRFHRLEIRWRIAVDTHKADNHNREAALTVDCWSFV